MAGTKEGGQKAAYTLRQEYGDDYYQKIGSKGGQAADHQKAVETTKERKGEDFYQRIGEKGGRAGGKSTTTQSNQSKQSSSRSETNMERKAPSRESE